VQVVKTDEDQERGESWCEGEATATEAVVRKMGWPKAKSEESRALAKEPGVANGAAIR